MGSLQAVIFDVDGTLADTEEVHRLAFNITFSQFGLDWEWSKPLYAQLLAISGGRERIQHYAERYRPGDIPAVHIYERVRELHRVKTEHYARMLVEGHVRLRPGVGRLLEELRSAALRMSIATSTQLSNVRTLLDHNLPAGWESWFEVIASCDIIEQKKPSPAVYDYVLDRMDLDPEHCLAIEDTQNGNRAALAAGVPTLITAHEFTRNHDFTGASLVLSDLGEPDDPFQVIRGDAGGARYVDLDMLRRLHGDPGEDSAAFAPLSMPRVAVAGA